MPAPKHDAPVTLEYASASRGHNRPLPSVLEAVVVISLFLTAGFIAVFRIPLLLGEQHQGVDLNRGKMRAMKTPLELYRLHVGAYPASLEDLVTPPSGTAAERWRGPYVANLDDLKDRWERPFRYRAPGVKKPGQYDLWSAGEDGVDGTRDDICNW
jgi:general secretion pathway protein G